MTSSTGDRDRVQAILDQKEFLTTDESWLCVVLLEALDTIDKAKAWHRVANVEHPFCVSCSHRWPCPTWQALNGGNE